MGKAENGEEKGIDKGERLKARRRRRRTGEERKGLWVAGRRTKGREEWKDEEKN